MAIDKTIRIQDLPPSNLLNNDNLIIINDSDNITRSITFEDFIGSINGFPDGINIPPSPGIPGLSFCPEDKPNCGTGIGSDSDCQLTIYVCSIPIIDVKPSPDGNHDIDINGNVEIENDLIVNDDTILKGNVNIGLSGCNPAYKLTVDNPTYLNCETFVAGDITIGTECSNIMTINSTATFGCKTTFNDGLEVDGDILLSGDLIIEGEIKPPNGGTLDIHVDNITVDNDLNVGGNAIIDNDLNVGGNVIIGDDCNTTLKIESVTSITCDTVIGNPNPSKNTNLDVYSDTFIHGQLEVDGDAIFDANLEVLSPGVIIGDGSGITNLNIPDNLTFRGDIDITKDKSDNGISTLENGDFYLNIVQGAPNSEYGLTEPSVNENVFVYYTTTTTPPKWVVGSDLNDDGLVTLNGNQKVTGSKEFTKQTTFTLANSDVNDLTVANIPSIVLTGSATSASTKTVDSDNTLVTKDYIDNLVSGGGGSGNDPLGGRFVEVVGDNMTGTLTLGPVDASDAPINTKITLNANGSASFKPSGAGVNIDSNGNVGIGTDSPLVPLHIIGNTRGQSEKDATVEFTLRGVKADGSTISDYKLRHTGSTDLFQLLRNGTDLVTVRNNGMVGIGMDNPGSKLNVLGTNNYDPVANPTYSDFDVRFTSGTASLSIGQANGTPVLQGSGSGTSWNICMNPFVGNVGIGTDNPQAKLHVDGTVRATVFDLDSLTNIMTV